MITLGCDNSVRIVNELNLGGRVSDLVTEADQLLDNFAGDQVKAKNCVDGQAGSYWGSFVTARDIGVGGHARTDSNKKQR